MHPDVMALLAADDEAKDLVAASRRRLQERLRMAQEHREAEEARLQQQRAEDVERLVRSIEDEAQRRAERRAEAIERLRQARAAAAERALAAGVEAYLAIVRGRSGSEHLP